MKQSITRSSNNKRPSSSMPTADENQMIPIKRKRASVSPSHNTIDISCLSSDMLHMILGFLVSDTGSVDGMTLRAVSLVSKKFNAVSYSRSLWSIPCNLSGAIDSRYGSLNIREVAQNNKAYRESLMGFIKVAQVTTKNVEDGATSYRVQEKATGKECILSLSKSQEKAAGIIKEVFDAHSSLEEKFLCAKNDDHHSNEASSIFPQGIRIWNNRIVRWYQPFADAHPVTPPTKQTDSLSVDAFRGDTAIVSSPRNHLFHLFYLQGLSGPIHASRRHVRTECWAMIVDWIVEVAECFDLDEKTIFQAMSYFDRVISTSTLPVKRKHFQLISAACLLIASKCNKHISISDICLCSDNSFSAQELQQTEEYVLCQLEWKLAFPTCIDFLDVLGSAILSLPKDCRTFQMMRYISELTLQSPIYLRYEPSMIAASCVVLARFCVQDDMLWDDCLEEQTSYSLLDLSECTMEISRLLDYIKSRFTDLIMIGRRYRRSTKRCVSQISIPVISSFATLSAYQGGRRRSTREQDQVPTV